MKKGEETQKRSSFLILHSPFLFAGIFYMINPFTYDRLMAGQYNVLFGYALLPWFAGALLKFLREPDWKKSFALSAQNRASMDSTQ